MLGQSHDEVEPLSQIWISLSIKLHLNQQAYVGRQASSSSRCVETILILSRRIIEPITEMVDDHAIVVSTADHGGLTRLR